MNSNDFLKNELINEMIKFINILDFPEVEYAVWLHNRRNFTEYLTWIKDPLALCFNCYKQNKIDYYLLSSFNITVHKPLFCKKCEILLDYTLSQVGVAVEIIYITNIKLEKFIDKFRFYKILKSPEISINQVKHLANIFLPKIPIHLIL